MTTDRPSLNWQAVQELQTIMGENFSLLLDTFFKDGANHLVAMQQSLKCDDLEATRSAAHSLKGSAGNMSAQVLEGLCRDLEIQAATGRAEGSQDLVSAIATEFGQVKVALQSIA